jgi:hypothetical protein
MTKPQIPSLYDFVRDNWHRVSNETFSEDRGSYALCSEISRALAEPNPAGYFRHRRCGKTIIGSVLLPIWVWMRDPAADILIVQPDKYWRNIRTRTFIRVAREMGIPVSGVLLSSQENPLGGSRVTTDPYVFLGYEADVLVFDDAFIRTGDSPMTRAAAREAREHWPCKLKPNGTLIELVS